jgi:hypothetical protein
VSGSGLLEMIFDFFIQDFLKKMAWCGVSRVENFKIYRLAICSIYMVVGASGSVFYQYPLIK